MTSCHLWRLNVLVMGTASSYILLSFPLTPLHKCLSSFGKSNYILHVDNTTYLFQICRSPHVSYAACAEQNDHLRVRFAPVLFENQ